MEFLGFEIICVKINMEQLRFWLIIVIVSSILAVTVLGCKQFKLSTDTSYITSIEQHRTQYKQDFKEHDGPLKTDEALALMNFYKPDPSYICTCKFVTLEDQPFVEFNTYAGKQKTYKNYGVAHCKVNGADVSLNLFQHGQYYNHPLYGKQLFVPFKDWTNGEETYGGGRYLDLSLDSVKGDILVIDFNKCYNPYCAYSDGYNCPIPPISNHLSVKVEAGEKMYHKE